jgi:hypothetical protein
MHDQSKKKDYQGPLYAPWSAVVAGRSDGMKMISTPHMSEAFLDSWKLQEENKNKPA